MKKLIVILAIFFLVPTISYAQCRGNDGSIGFYNPTALIATAAMIASAGYTGATKALAYCLDNGEAVLLIGKNVELLETRSLDDGNILVLGRMDNGRLIFTFGNMLRCK